MNHPDREWINKRTGKHGACYTLSGINEGACRIEHIGKKSFIYVFYLNVILYFKWLKRRIKKWFKFNIQIGG